MVPPWLVTRILTGMAKLLPRLKLVPTNDLAELAFRDEKKKKLVGVLSLNTLKAKNICKGAFGSKFSTYIIFHTGLGLKMR